MTQVPLLLLLILAIVPMLRAESVLVTVGNQAIRVPVPDGFDANLPADQDRKIQEILGNRVLLTRQKLDSPATDFMVRTSKAIEVMHPEGVSTQYFAKVLTGCREPYVKGFDQTKFKSAIDAFNAEVAKRHGAGSGQSVFLPLGVKYEDAVTGVYQALCATASNNQKLLEAASVTIICCLVKNQVIAASFTSSVEGDTNLSWQSEVALKWALALHSCNSKVTLGK